VTGLLGGVWGYWVVSAEFCDILISRPLYETTKFMQTYGL